MRTRSPLIRLCLPSIGLALLSACGGGGSTPVAPTRAAAPAPTASSVSSTTGTKMKSSVMITLHDRSAAAAAAMNAHGKRRSYISPSTTGIVLTVTDSTAKTTSTIGYDVSPQSASETATACGPTTNGSRTCTLAIPVVGGDNVTVGATIYDAVPSPLGMNPATTPTDSGNALATGTSAATAITANQVNTISIALEGIGARLESLVYGVPDVAPFEKLPYFTFHVVDYDGNPIDAYDATAAFATPVTFGVTDNGDVSGCPDGKNEHCTAFNFATSTVSSTISEPNDNNDGDEAQQIFFEDTLTNGTGGTGDEISTPPYYATFVASPNTGAVAGGAQSGIVTMAPLFAFPAGLGLTGTTPGTITADQYALPSGSSGYSIASSNCTDIATLGSGSTAKWGESFSVTGITNGSCNVTLDDGVAADAVTAGVSVSGFTTSQVSVQQAISFGGSKGAAVSSITPKLMNPPNTGDTVLLVVAQGATAVTTPAGYTSLANVVTSSSSVGYAVFAKDVTSSADQSVTVTVPGTTEALSYYFAELFNTHAALITTPTGKYTAANATSSTTPTVTTDGNFDLVFTGASSSLYGSATGGDPYTATAGYSEGFDSGGTSIVGTQASSLDFQTTTVNAPAATTNTFTLGQPNGGTSPYPATDDFIFFARPAS